MITVLLGAPGSGKSTWVRKNAQGFEHVYCLDGIRANPELDIQAFSNLRRMQAIKAVENGQPPKTRVKVKSIEEWIQNKGIQPRGISKKSLAIAITKKIYNRGTAARPFISPALTDKTQQVLSDRIGKYIADTLAGE